MKKLANWMVVLLALVVLAGCGAKPQTAESDTDAQAAGETESGAAETAGEAEDAEITLARLVEANRAAALLDKYGSLAQTAVTEYGGETYFSSAYTEKDLAFVQYAENLADTPDGAAGAYLSTAAGDAYYFGADGGLVFSVCLYALPEAEQERLAPEEYELLDAAGTLQETITGVTELDGGAIRIDTETETSRLSYVADAETLELRSMEEDEESAYTGIMTFHSTITPGAARPALAEEMLDLLNGALTAEDNRTVTIITDPGQEEEQIYDLTVKKGVGVFPVVGEDYTLCQQTPAGMFPFEGDSDLDADLALYALADYQAPDYPAAEG